MVKFRYRRAVPLDYDTQGHIYFLLRRFHRLDKEEQKKIREICRKAAGVHAPAVLEYVTAGRTSVAVCDKYRMSESTLERMVKRLYVALADVV